MMIAAQRYLARGAWDLLGETFTYSSCIRKEILRWDGTADPMIAGTMRHWNQSIYRHCILDPCEHTRPCVER